MCANPEKAEGENGALMQDLKLIPESSLSSLSIFDPKPTSSFLRRGRSARLAFLKRNSTKRPLVESHCRPIPATQNVSRKRTSV